MLPVCGTYSTGDIPSGSELLLHHFPFIRAVQIFVLEFSKDGSADLGDEFEDGDTANQPVVLQGGVGLSNGQVAQGYGQFESNFQWLPEIGDCLLDAVMNLVSLENTPVLSVCDYGLSGVGTACCYNRLALIVSCLVMKKLILIPSQVWILVQTSWYGLRPVWNM